MTSKTKSFLARYPLVINVYRLFLSKFDLLYRYEDLNDEYYKWVSGGEGSVAAPAGIEVEHQIGRLNNYKKILSEARDLPGEVIEFGTWNGFSLIWMAYICERLGIFNKKFYGVDGFKGLPNDEGEFKKGGFSDASKKKMLQNVKTSPLYFATREKFVVVEREFKNADDILSDLGGIKFSVIHIDCDLSSSFLELEPILPSIMADKCFILFDDYGCETNLKDAVDAFMAKRTAAGFTVTVHSKTKLTKNFFIQKN